MELKNISKSFLDSHVLSGVQFSIVSGEVHALLGEKSSGKSVMASILAGIQQPDEGQIYLDGQSCVFHTPYDSLRMGIVLVHQNAQCLLHRPVYENVFLGQELCNKIGVLSYKDMQKKTQTLFAGLGFDIDPLQTMSVLNLEERQLVGIAKALLYDARIIIFDETHKIFGEKNLIHFFRILKKLKQEHKAILFNTYKIDEVFRIADKVTVLRGGRIVKTASVSEINNKALFELMTGSKPKKSSFVWNIRKPGNELFRIKDYTDYRHIFHNIDFSVREGEILAIIGMSGAERTTLARSIFGLRPRLSGSMYIREKKVDVTNPLQALVHKIAFLPESWEAQEIYSILSVQDNLIISILHKHTRLGFLKHYALERMCMQQKDILNIRIPYLYTPIQDVDTGNQKKILIGRYLLAGADVFIFDEPMRGVNFINRIEIYRIMMHLTEQGKALILFASELSELSDITNRILFLKGGSIHARFAKKEETKDSIQKKQRVMDSDEILSKEDGNHG